MTSIRAMYRAAFWRKSLYLDLPGKCEHKQPYKQGSVRNHISIYIYIITWKTVWTFFLSIMGFTRNGRFFCSIAYFGFWLWRVVQILWQHRVRTSSDSFQKRNFSPKWSKLGVMIGHPNLATNTAIFPTKFGCTHKIPVFFQHHVEKKTVSKCQHTAQNTVSRGDTHTVGTNPTNPRV